MQSHNIRTVSRNRHRLRIISGSLGIIALLVIVGILNTGALSNRLITPAKLTTNSSSASDLSDQEQAFFEYVQPRLISINAESHALADLGRRKSRNLLEIRVRGNRVTKAVDEINRFVAESGLPPKFAQSFESYQEGVGNVQNAMDTARNALLSLNFDRVPSAVEQFDAGTFALDKALRQFEQESGIPLATPAATSSSLTYYGA